MTRAARDDLRRIMAEALAAPHARALLLSAWDEWASQPGAADGARDKLVRRDPAGYLDEPRAARKFSVGIVACDATDVAPASFEQLISRLRDLECERVYVYRPQAVSVADDRRVRALGLRLLRTYPGEGAAAGGRLYYFDIFDYKDAPDWLSSRFWANPQMWNKARW